MSAAPLRVVAVVPSLPDPTDRDRGDATALALSRGAALAGGDQVAVELVVPAGPPGAPCDGDIAVRELSAIDAGGGYGDATSWELGAAVADADVVHIHQVATRWGEAALLAARLWDRAVCVTDHGRGTSPLGTGVGAQLLAGAVVSPSRYGEGLLPGARRILRVPGGVDARRFSPPARPVARTGVVVAAPLVTMADLEHLCALLPARISPWLAGGVAPGVLEALPPGARVVTSDAELRVAAAAALAVLGPFEARAAQQPALPVTLLAAMGCGAPAVAAPVGAVPELVVGGRSGFLCSDDGALRAALAALAADGGAVVRLGAGARQVAVDHDLRRAGAQLLGIYRELAGGG